MVKKPHTDPPICTNNIMSMLDALDVLGGKWRLLILHYLLARSEETNTFKKIEKDVQGISAKMLSKELKVLESNKLITRKIMNTRPVTVQYSITGYGKEARHIIASLVEWGQRHRLFLFGENHAD